MEPVRIASSVPGITRIQERNAGGRRDAEAFRRALEQEAQDRAPGEPMPGDEPPVRTRLQRQRPDSRSTAGVTARHVDVIA